MDTSTILFENLLALSEITKLLSRQILQKKFLHERIQNSAASITLNWVILQWPRHIFYPLKGAISECFSKNHLGESILYCAVNEFTSIREEQQFV